MALSFAETIKQIDDLHHQCQRLYDRAEAFHLASKYKDTYEKCLGELHYQYVEYDALLSRALEEHPDNAFLWFRRAWAYQFFQQPEAALKDTPPDDFEWVEQAYLRVIELDPTCAAAYVMLALLYYWSDKKKIQQEVYGRYRDLLDLLREPSSDEQRERLMETADKYVQELLDAQANAIYADSHEMWRKLMAARDWAFEYDAWEKGLTVGGDRHPYLQEPAWTRYEDYIYEMLVPGLEHPTSERGCPVPPEVRGDIYYLLAQAEIEVPGNAPRIEDRWWSLDGLYDEATRCNFREPSRSVYCRLLASSRFSDEREPLGGLKLLEEAHEIVRQTDMKLDSLVCSTARLLDASPSLHQNPRTLNFLRQVLNEGEMAVDNVSTAKLFWYAGRMCSAKGMFREAQQYLEKAEPYLFQFENYLQDLALVYMYQEQHSRAIAELGRISNPDSRTQLMIEFARWAKDNNRQASVLADIFSRVEGLDQKFDKLYGLVSELGETLADQFRQIQLPPPTPDTDDEDFAEQVAESVVDQVRNILAPQKVLLDDVRKVCEKNLTTTWTAFPNNIQELITQAEAMHIVFEEQDMLPSAPLVLQWGKVCEVTFKTAFFRPFLAYLDKKGHRSDIPIGTVYDRNRKWLGYRGSWESAENAPFLFVEGLLWSARSGSVSGNGTNLVNQFLQDNGLSLCVWTEEIPQQLASIRSLRNKAAHGSYPLQKSEADKVRAILISHGLLARAGEALKRVKRKY